jgi:hypothetical protein
MATRRNRISKRRNYKGTRKYGGKKGKNGKKWTTAVEAGDKTLSKTGSLNKAKESLRSQALLNARKLFGSIGKTL